MQISIDEASFRENPSQYQGFFERRAKRQVDLTVNGRLYTVTAKGLLVSRRPLEGGKNWYSYLNSQDELFASRREEAAWIESLSVGRDSRGLLFR